MLQLEWADTIILNKVPQHSYTHRPLQHCRTIREFDLIIIPVNGDCVLSEWCFEFSELFEFEI